MSTGGGGRGGCQTIWQPTWPSYWEYSGYGNIQYLGYGSIKCFWYENNQYFGYNRIKVIVKSSYHSHKKGATFKLRYIMTYCDMLHGTLQIFT